MIEGEFSRMPSESAAFMANMEALLATLHKACGGAKSSSHFRGGDSALVETDVQEQV